MDYLEIGRMIQRARKSMCPPVTQLDVAQALGMSTATISQIENGRATDIGLRRLMRVAEYVGLEIALQKPRSGYTLDDAKEDLREASLRRPGLKG